MDDQRVEVAGIGEGAAHHLGVHHAARAIGEGDRACRLQQADLGHFLAGKTLGQRRHRMNVDDCGIPRAAQHEIDGRGIVDGR